jgi:hypothetical protein
MRWIDRRFAYTSKSIKVNGARRVRHAPCATRLSQFSLLAGLLLEYLS